MGEDKIFYHAVFVDMGDGFYKVEKDVFEHLPEDCVVSGCIMNSYRGIVPSGARVAIVPWKEMEDAS